MTQFSTRSIGGDVHHDADTASSRILDVELAGADEWHVSKTSNTSGGCGKGRMDVISRGEQDADDVIVVDTIALDHFIEKSNGALLHLIDGIDVDCRGTAQGPH